MSNLMASPMTDTRRAWWQHWPSLLGLAIATSQVFIGVDVEGTAITVAAAASCYVAAAALDRRWIAWAGIGFATAVVVASELVAVAWWVGLTAYATLLMLIGLARGAHDRMLAQQSAAMICFGGLAVIAILVSPRLGLFLAGCALASHALWDWRHWRRNDVVPRSMAEFCILLDVPLGTAAVAVAVMA